MLDDQFPILQDIIKRSHSKINDWLASIDQRAFYSNRNWWIGLASVAADKALRQDDTPLRDRLEWARIAVNVYGNVDKYRVSGCENCINSAMRLRVLLINMFGHRADENLLDLRVLERWFLDNLKLSFEQATEISQQDLETLWNDHRDMFVEARRTKVRIGILSKLDDAYRSALGETTRRWLKVGRLLP